MITTGAVSISQALMVNQTLLKLDMSYNKIGDDGITAISKSFSNSSITELRVQGCGITFTGMIPLAAALAVNQNIKLLNLLNNAVTFDGANMIMKSAVNNGVCERVIVSDAYHGHEVKKMENILYDRRIQNVRNYVV